MKADAAGMPREPVPLMKCYASELEEVLYHFNETREYGQPKIVEVVEFRKGFKRISEENCAYGLRINVSRTRIGVLDFDTCTFATVSEAVESLSHCKSIQHMDIAISSEEFGGSYHLYLGFNGWYNIANLYNLNVNGSCIGFNSCCSRLGIITIRQSAKFYKDGRFTPAIKWKEGWSRKKGNIWLRYSSEQLIVPSTTADGVSVSTTERQRKLPLRLRG